MNGVKNVIQKEEYIALAINKYILQTGTIPKKNNNTLDWTKLETAEYLGTNFNKKNPITSTDMEVVFVNNNAYIKGVISSQTDFNSEYNSDYYLHFGFIRQRLKRRQTYLFMCRLTSHIDLNQ